MRFLSILAGDLRFALRMIRRNLMFSAVAIVCLALGIGATSAITSLVYALWVDPYPYRDSNRLLNLGFVNPQGRDGTMWYSLADYIELNHDTKTLEDVAGRDGMSAVVTSGLPESVSVVLFTPNAFDHFGVPAMIGRTWTPRDIPQPGAPPAVAVLSYLFWTRHFNSQPNVIGRRLELNRKPYTILGVVPPRFTWNDADVYIPLAVTPDPKHFIALMTHVRKGIGLKAVDAELQAMTDRFARRNPNGYPKNGFRMRVQTLNDFLLRRFGGTLKVLMAAVALLLLIGCANVSILLLARATVRQREIAIRVSIGAPARRILRQLLTESVVLAVSGGVLGVLLAYGSVPAIVAMMPQYSVPHEAVIRVNGQVVLLTFAISVLTGILFGMAPAFHLAGTNVAHAMQSGTRGSSGGRGGKLRGALIVAEIALTIVLLTGASVAIRSFLALERVPLGYRPENVLSLNVDIPQGRYGSWASRNQFFDRAAADFNSIPGVKRATFTETALPPYIGFTTEFEIAGRAKMDRQSLHVGLIGPSYFKTLGIPVLQGRLLTEADIVQNAHLAVINEELRKRYFSSGAGPVGARIHVPGLKINDAQVFTPPTGDEWFEVVGVVGTALNRGLQEAPEPAIYVPYKMATVPSAVFLLQTEVDPMSVVRTARQRLRSIDSDLPVTQVRTLEEYLSRFERAYPRFSMTLFTIFAGLGLLLAATGLYSVVSYAVAQRTQEFGIRMALGARPRHVLQLVAGSVTALIAAGSFAGLAGSLALSGTIARFVAGWNPHDPVAYVAVVAVLAFTGLLACWLPARRATGIEPADALRHD